MDEKKFQRDSHGNILGDADLAARAHARAARANQLEAWRVGREARDAVRVAGGTEADAQAAFKAAELAWWDS